MQSIDDFTVFPFENFIFVDEVTMLMLASEEQRD
jgi:hypothetical protein